MIELSTIRDLVAIFGVLVGFSYYVLTVRANQKNQQLMLKAQQQMLETRQAQLYMYFASQMTSESWADHMLNVLNSKWSNLEEFRNGITNPQRIRYHGVLYLTISRTLGYW